MKKFIPYGKHFIDNETLRVLKPFKGNLTQGPKILEFEKNIKIC